MAFNYRACPFYRETRFSPLLSTAKSISEHPCRLVRPAGIRDGPGMRIPAIALVAFAGMGFDCGYSQAPAASAETPAAVSAVVADPGMRAQSDIQALVVQLKLYQAINGILPTTRQGLQALVTQPATDPKPAHWLKLLSRTPLDPWGHPYLYKRPGVHNPEGYDIYSAGADGIPGTADDIGNW
jgi:type II secretion system protein G